MMNEARFLRAFRGTTIRIFKTVAVVAALMAIVTITFSLPARADGGPMVDPQLFAKLKEGQQVAVIRLQDVNTASVDLFVSILDQTGEAHDVVFFVPLGMKATLFYVREQDSLAFNEDETNQLDMAIFQDYRQDKMFLENLFAGTLLTNGVWLTPLWLPFLLSGCQGAPPPVSTYKTDSSEVSVFDINENTDLAALISTTGLDPSVIETLSRLKGQQIAVVNLQTRPKEAVEGTGEGDNPVGEPGLHLSWATTLVPSEDGATYAYPLGTGAAWAHPIEMTRVYVVAPAELEFTVQYPELGEDLSGFVKKQWSYEPRIVDAGQAPAYAVAEAIERSVYYGGLYNIWRATYANSNAAEDIIITANKSSGVSLGLLLRRAGPLTALIVGLLVAALFWVLAWYFLMPRLLGGVYRGKEMWRFSLTYLGWNLLLFLPGGVLYFIFSFGEQALALLVLVLIFGAVSVMVFSLRHLHRWGVSTARAIRAFVTITLVSNGAYLLFILGYARLVSAV